MARHLGKLSRILKQRESLEMWTTQKLSYFKQRKKAFKKISTLDPKAQERVMKKHRDRINKQI